MFDTGQDGDSYRRVEVITGQRRRRRWTGEEKARIVAESFERGANISEVAPRWRCASQCDAARDAAQAVLSGRGSRRSCVEQPVVVG
ncbi:transposase [Bradyrhizobium sp. CCBAU 51753]|uniref:transposase n=1 Tax=Bradyrhizobium sp. CCBAU 51753 TaxID=1325100 RepID=UPI001FED6A39|nr:transposase [Bradyrhizobium sp. CCBAU 51753]